MTKATKQEAGRLGYEKTVGALDAQRAEQGRVAREKHAQNSPACRQCGAPIDYEHRANKFCNSVCSGIFNNTGEKAKRKLTHVCRTCDTPIYASAVFCSTCIDGGRYVMHPPNIDEFKTDRTRRKALIYLHGHSCWVCLSSVWQGQPIPLELDHIDGNSENNAEENLRLICPNCHALTPTYKNKNKGSGRHARRQRYAEGKSC